MPAAIRRPRARLIALLVLAVALTSAAGAWAARSPRSGAYRAKGAVTFTFKLTPGTCPLPPRNLSNPSARRGNEGKGLCWRSAAIVPVNPSCGADGHAISGLTADLNLFSGLRLAAGGLHVKSYAYGSGPKPIGYTELALTIHGATGTGFIRVTQPDGLNHPCDTGRLKFRVAHR